MNYIDLFAGAGGLSEGFLRSGYNSIAHIELDSDACYTLKTRLAYHYLKSINQFSFYERYLRKEISRDELYEKIPSDLLDSVINKEITEHNLKEIFKDIRLLLKTKKKKKIHAIVGGPPCQAYSLIGRSKLNNLGKLDNDPRLSMYKLYGEFLKEFKPNFFVFENVRGLLSMNKGELIKTVQLFFKTYCNYDTVFRLESSNDYGVLQKRQRIIMIGFPLGKSIDPDELYPKKTEYDYTVNNLFTDLPKLKPGGIMDIAEYITETNEYLKVSGIRNGLNFTTQHITRNHNERDLEIYKLAIEKWNNKKERLKYTELPKRLITHKNPNIFLDKYKVVAGNLNYSHTIMAHISKDGHYFIHPDIEQCRSLSVREAARIQSFPDDYYFEGSRTAAFKQIGNAVPPLMGELIAKKLKNI
jgi:DNA (cytosine-5)-methyltransferase 1